MILPYISALNWYLKIVFHGMFVYDKTFDPKIVVGHCKIILWFSDFPISWNSVCMFSYFFQIMNEYEQTFDLNVLITCCDLISRFSDFALYLNTQLVYDHISFTWVSMTRPLTLKCL